MTKSVKKIKEMGKIAKEEEMKSKTVSVVRRQVPDRYLNYSTPAENYFLCVQNRITSCPFFLSSIQLPFTCHPLIVTYSRSFPRSKKPSREKFITQLCLFLSLFSLFQRSRPRAIMQSIFILFYYVTRISNLISLLLLDFTLCIHNTATQKKVLSPEVRPCILYVFGVAESKSGVR